MLEVVIAYLQYRHAHGVMSSDKTIRPEYPDNLLNQRSKPIRSIRNYPNQWKQLTVSTLTGNNIKNFSKKSLNFNQISKKAGLTIIVYFLIGVAVILVGSKLVSLFFN